jgi:hypothetical protein
MGVPFWKGLRDEEARGFREIAKGEAGASGKWKRLKPQV